MDLGRAVLRWGTQGLWNPKGDTKLNLEVEVREDFWRRR